MRCRPALIAFLIGAILGAQPAAAIEMSEDVPVPAGMAAIARDLGLATVPDRARFVAEITRLLHDSLDRRNDPLQVLRQQFRRLTIGGRSTDRVPVPLTTAIWSGAVFRRQIAPSDLLVTILGDRQASLLCHGLGSLDTETLRYLGTHPLLLTNLYQSSAAAFGAFAGGLHIRGDRVVPAGGEAAIELWEAIVGEKVTTVDRFVTALFAHADGRVAYMYDTIDQLDSARRAFALGLWIADRDATLNAMKALATAWVHELPEWRLQTQPFTRPIYDAASLLMRMRVDPSGAPAPPSSPVLWSRAFESLDLPDDPSRLLTASTDGRVGAAWLVEITGGSDARQRADRLDQLSFGQRVFASASAADMPDVLVALRAFPRYRMLMLALDRMGIRTPAVYAAAARRAHQLSTLAADRAFVATAEFQSALALLGRMTMVGTISGARTEALARDLIALQPNTDGRYGGAVVRWLDETLRPAVGRADTLEASLVTALAGPAAAAAQFIQWEGQQYRLDLAGSERRRLERVREKQGGPPMDVALDLTKAARALTAPSLTLSDVQAVAQRLRATIRDHAAELRRAEADADARPAGVDPPAKALDRLDAGINVLSRSADTKDLDRAGQFGAQLMDLADEVAARALMALTYAVSIGDPGGPAVLAGDVSVRHDFGLRSKNPEDRVRVPWTIPYRHTAPGLPWHVDGSLLGLDVALAPLALRRVNPDRVPEAPTLTTNAREAFAQSVALLNPFTLTDRARDGVAEAIALGEQRVAQLSSAPDGLDRLAAEIGMDGARRRATAWTLENDADRTLSMFSLRELLVLGHPDAAIDLDPWGMSGLSASGCLCTEMPPPGRSVMIAGRPQTGLMIASLVDLNLHVARVLRDLGLPAPLAAYVLGAAVQDLIDDARPTDADDWMTLSRAARAVSRERIEDYVAAVTADGSLVPDTTPPSGAAR